jgi:DNA-binding NtrC family response regulator
MLKTIPRLQNILIVDDEDEARLGLSKLLSVKGYHVLTASNGVEALEVLRNQPTSIIITDIKMPEMDGLTFLREIKKLIPGIKVVIITGYGEVETYLEAMNLGAIEFLHKPIQFDDLVKVINKL